MNKRTPIHFSLLLFATATLTFAFQNCGSKGSSSGSPNGQNTPGPSPSPGPTPSNTQWKLSYNLPIDDAKNIKEIKGIDRASLDSVPDSSGIMNFNYEEDMLICGLGTVKPWALKTATGPITYTFTNVGIPDLTACPNPPPGAPLFTAVSNVMKIQAPGTPKEASILVEAHNDGQSVQKVDTKVQRMKFEAIGQGTGQMIYEMDSADTCVNNSLRAEATLDSATAKWKIRFLKATDTAITTPCELKPSVLSTKVLIQMK